MSYELWMRNVELNRKTYQLRDFVKQESDIKKIWVDIDWVNG